MKAIYNKILKKITPTKSEILEEQMLVAKIREQIDSLEGKHSHLEWCGSSARGTHLRGDRDLDLFIMFDKAMPGEELEKEGLRIAKKIFKGHKWELAYSQHPYIRGEIKGFEVEIVPSYIVASGAEKQSAVDRTPFHNKYLLNKLSAEDKQEARLLKQFLKGINAYGADLKNCSLPGYGVELLIVKYGSFDNAILEISRWWAGKIITFSNQTEENAKKAFAKENYPLILIDPVDSSRNVASALSREQFERIVYASQLFLKNPSEKFFFPKNKKPWAKKKVLNVLKKKELIALHAHFPKNELSDIVWGQLRRFEKKTANHLKEKDFSVMQSGVWSDEKEIIFMYELETLTLQKSKKVKGPMASDKENTKKFLDKKRKILSGPRIEDGHIVIEIEREETSAHKVLEKFIKLGKKDEKNAVKKMLQKATVLSEAQIIKHYKGEFASHLTNYLEGKEIFE